MPRRGLGRVVGFWNDHFIVLELALALVVAGAFLVWVQVWDGWAPVNAMLQGKRESVYGALAALLGSLLGFVIAAVAIVIGEAARLQFLRDSGQLPNLLDVFRKSIQALGLGTCVAVLSLVLDGDAQPSRVLPGLVLFVTLLAGLRVGRAVWVLNAVMKYVAKLDPGEKA